jgi:hypothetical protein
MGPRAAGRRCSISPTVQKNLIEMGAIFDPKKEKKKTTPGKHRKRQISWMPFFQHQVVFSASLA